MFNCLAIQVKVIVVACCSSRTGAGAGLPGFDSLRKLAILRVKGKPLKTAENLFALRYTGLKAAVLVKRGV